MNYCKIPSINECYKIMEGRILPHIKEHSEQVMRVALIIVDNLKPDITINRNLVISACLLHDITKAESLNTKEHHDITGGEYIRKLVYPEVADIITEHVELKNYNLTGNIEEKEIVFYADKRVMHTEIVTVEERISDLLIRYGKTQMIRRHIIKNKDLILNIEKKIKGNMNYDLNNLLTSLNQNIRLP